MSEVEYKVRGYLEATNHETQYDELDRSAVQYDDSEIDFSYRNTSGRFEDL